ncbi:MAG: uroporphyrinogen decarboxylase [Chloroflexi bacterium]|nr:uroporphyrinogen decarboxylase [Chloroflexota bacterium]
MLDEIKALFEERLGRYQATIALEPADRIPIAPGTNYFSEIYSGCTNQEIVYDPQRWLEAEVAFSRAFPEVDVLRSNRLWAPLHDTVGYKLFRLPGRDLPPRTQFQYVEQEYMKADEYRLLLDEPLTFIVERYLPRVLGEFAERGSTRSYLAFLKGGMAYVMQAQIMRQRADYLETQLGLPQPMAGGILAPFDYLADGLRGLNGIMLDIRRQPDNVLAACDAIVPELVSAALAGADPLRRYPIFLPFHKGCFLSPKQFDTFYWPSTKKAMMMLIDAGYVVRAYLEGDWTPHWHHMLELPRGKVVCDIDVEADIARAKADIGHHHCVAGGVPDSLLILGTPSEVRERVKLLCETVGKDGGFIISGGCNIPYDTKPENFRAMIDAILEFGTYDPSVKPKPKVVSGPPPDAEGIIRPYLVFPWEEKRAELGGVLGDADLIRRPWEMLEAKAYHWLWMWSHA